MAGIDYGCIIKINGRVYDVDTIKLDAKNNSLYPISEICFYKCSILFYSDSGILCNFILPIQLHYDGRGKKYRLKTNVAGVDFDIKRLDEGDRYIAKFKINDDKYEVIYGYGVDYDLDLWYDLKPNKKNWLKKWMTNK